jgi:hypothetical protein
MTQCIQKWLNLFVLDVSNKEKLRHVKNFVLVTSIVEPVGYQVLIYTSVSTVFLEVEQQWSYFQIMTRIRVFHVNQTVPAVRNGQITAPAVTIISFFMIRSVMPHVPHIHMRQKIMGMFSYLNLHYVLLLVS